MCRECFGDEEDVDRNLGHISTTRFLDRRLVFLLLGAEPMAQTATLALRQDCGVGSFIRSAVHDGHVIESGRVEYEYNT
jgi:hypothetical protein